ncbi:acetyltransferase [Epilithonimonas arachidiradicis]|uniref:Acetyltransferase n=1 Tax=Epilithonimonas arachidiradicis TaxID=1617282 RepID=A0A420DBV6_9FLAO|nr:acetyltransferase [Epilithonimonas arachidiradicis]RKE89000.1 acetyltransferase EpsM [Epilithonimonas arachidiradicis]GGG53358.1 acetyltransferase [Epilithonimonas arachidiradicis]
MEIKNINILGAGGHAKVVIEIAEELDYKINEIYDQNPEVSKILDYNVSNNLETLTEKENVFFALGNNFNRKSSSQKYHFANFNLVHPSAIISTRTKIGVGNVIMAGVVINSSVKIGSHCIINTSACIDHDCEIEDFVHISPNVALAGNVKIKEGAQVGIGASVKQNITIGSWSVIGAGAVVINDVPENVVVVGNPAKIIKSVVLK